MSPNTFRVPKGQWASWSEHAKRVFNELYGLMNVNQTIFTHPKQPKTDPEQWRTVCWNASWMAADAVDEHCMKPGDTVCDMDPGAKTVVKQRKVK